MIFIKIIEIFFWLITLPFSLLENVIPHIPQGLENLLSSFLNMLQSGLSLIISVLTLGGDSMCITLLSACLALFVFRFNYKWILKLVQKVIDKIP